MEAVWKDYNIYYNILCFLITENEKFFDKSDAKLYWTTVFHIFGTLHHYYVGNFASNIELTSSAHLHLDNLYRFRLAYLTGWNFMFQTVFLSLALLYDVLEWLDKHQSQLGKKLIYYRDVVFSGMVVPFTMFISLMFWSVYLVDRELVFPSVYDSIVPWWFNHCVHTNICVLVLVETLLTRRRNPMDKRLELSLVGGIGILYAIVYYSIYFATGRWLYQVFGVMTWWQVCLYQLVIWGSTFIFYYLQFPINRIFHREKKLEHKVDQCGVKNTEYDPEEWSRRFGSKQTENSHL